MTRGLQEPNPVFPLGAKGLVFANSECTATSGHITTAKNKKRRATMSDHGGNNQKNRAGKWERVHILEEVAGMSEDCSGRVFALWRSSQRG